MSVLNTVDVLILHRGGGGGGGVKNFSYKSIYTFQARVFGCNV